MGGAEKRNVTVGLGLCIDARSKRWVNAVERATLNLATEDTRTTETKTETMAEENSDGIIKYILDPTKHTFSDHRKLRKDSHEAMGLATEYREAWTHEDYVQQVYAGKKQKEVQYELQTVGTAVWLGYMERKREETNPTNFFNCL